MGEQHCNVLEALAGSRTSQIECHAHDINDAFGTDALYGVPPYVKNSRRARGYGTLHALISCESNKSACGIPQVTNLNRHVSQQLTIIFVIDTSDPNPMAEHRISVCGAVHFILKRFNENGCSPETKSKRSKRNHKRTLSQLAK